MDDEERWLREQYWVRERSLGDMAEEMGLTAEGVRYRMEKYGIERRGHANDVDPIPAWWLTEMYHDRGNTLAECAEEWGCSVGFAYKEMERHGLERRSRGTPTTVRHWFTNKGYAMLSNEYKGERDDVQHSRLLATLLVDDIEELRGMEVHHELSPGTLYRIVGEAADLNWLGNIDVMAQTDHRSLHAND